MKALDSFKKSLEEEYNFPTSYTFKFIIASKSKDKVIPVNVYMGVDLAYEANANNDYQVIMVTAIDSEKNYYILEYYHDHLPLYEMPQKIFEIAKQYNPVRRVNVEHVGAQGIIQRWVPESNTLTINPSTNATYSVRVLRNGSVYSEASNVTGLQTFFSNVTVPIGSYSIEIASVSGVTFNQFNISWEFTVTITEDDDEPEPNGTHNQR